MAHSRLVVGFCMLGATLWGCVGAPEQSPTGQTGAAARTVDAGWADACSAVANSMFRSVERQYVSSGGSSGRMTYYLRFEGAAKGLVHWQHLDFVSDLDYRCEGFDIYADQWSNRAIGHFNAASDVLTWDQVDYIRD